MSRRIDYTTPPPCGAGCNCPEEELPPVAAQVALTVKLPPLNALKAFTEEQNRIYAKAGKAKKRVMIAQDVLRALKAKRIVPEAGTYIDAPGTYVDGWAKSPLREAANNDPRGSFQELLPTLPACTVCAKGAIFVCTVLRQNQVQNDQLAARTATGLFADDTLSEALKGVFSPAQLGTIENEFECKRICGRGKYAVMGLQRFGEKRRMKEIMQNIVRNGGTFKPKKALKSQQRSQRDQDNA